MRLSSILSIAAICGLIAAMITGALYKPAHVLRDASRASVSDVKDELRDLARAAASDPLSLYTWITIGQNCALFTEPAEAIGWWSKRTSRYVVDEFCGTGLALYWTGSALNNHRNPELARAMWERSRAELERFVAEKPDQATWMHWNQLGWARYRCDAPGEALAAFDVARAGLVETDAPPSRCFPVALRLAEGYRNVGRPDVSVQIYAYWAGQLEAGDESFATAARWGELERWVGYVYPENRNEPGIGSSRRTERRIAAWHELGWAMAFVGDASGALEAWRHIIPLQAEMAQETNHRLDWYNLARLRSLCGEHARALDDLERAVDRGWDHHELTERDEAFTAIRAEPRFQSILERCRLQQRRARDRFREQAEDAGGQPPSASP